MKTQYILKVTSYEADISEEEFIKETSIDGDDYILVQKVIRALKTVDEEDNWFDPHETYKDILSIDDINNFWTFIRDESSTTIKQIEVAPYFQWSVLF